jgi:hypothetical protein
MAITQVIPCGGSTITLVISCILIVSMVVLIICLSGITRIEICVNTKVFILT